MKNGFRLKPDLYQEDFSISKKIIFFQHSPHEYVVSLMEYTTSKIGESGLYRKEKC